MARNRKTNKRRKNKNTNKNTNKNVKKVCSIVCNKTRNVMKNFVNNKKYLNTLTKKCKKSCVKKYGRKTRSRRQKGGSTTGVLPSVFTNLADSVSHSAMSTVNMFNGYPVGDSPLPFLAHYKTLF